MPPKTKYARSGDVNIAYQVVGDGPIDVVFVMGWVSNIDEFWTEPGFARFLNKLASFSRLIVFDKRGTGLSDRVSADRLPSLEVRMDDVRAVMDAAGSQRAAVIGVSEGGPMSALFAATYPERTRALVIIGGYARSMYAGDYPWGRSVEEYERYIHDMAVNWGGPVGIRARAPSKADDPRFRDWWSGYLRAAASPGTAVALSRMNMSIDVRPVLPVISAPALIMHARDDGTLKVEHGRFLAEHIRGARYVELDSQDHLPWVTDTDTVVGEIEEFLTGARHAVEPDRVLATVLFTDIVESTAHAAAMGDRRWREVLESHAATIETEVTRYQGRIVGDRGDGFVATFDGPARAIRCARALCDAVRPLGIEIRAGLHTGECEIIGGEIGGIAVHIGARVSALAGASEVLVSSTLKDLVAGSGIEFTDRGAHQLKGVPGEWRMFAVAGA
jgi:pimeloyl-ACP methyl ester carboxylesterase